MTSLLFRTRDFTLAVARFAGRRGVGAAVLVAIGAVLEGFGILLLVPLLATLFGRASIADGWALTRVLDRLAPMNQLALLLALFGAIMVVRFAVLWWRDVRLGRLQIGFVENCRGAVVRALAGARWGALAKIGHARITYVMSGDIQRCGAGVQFLFQSGVAVALVAVQAGVALFLSPLLAGAAIGFMLIGAIAMSRLLRRANDIGRMVTETNLALTESLGRFLGAMKLAMSQNLQGAFVTAFDRELAYGAARQADFIGQQAVMRGAWSLLAAGTAAATVLIGFGVLHLSAPLLLTLLVVLARIGGPASQIQLGVQQIAYSLSAWDAFVALERELALAAAAPAGVSGADMRGPIRFERVTYRHAAAEARHDAGLIEFDLDIARGEMVGLRGASGSGKTTLADVLAGLLTPQQGRIMIGGQQLSAANMADWRERVAYIAQDPVLFHDTIRANLLWSCPDADDAAIGAALDAAGASGLVAALPLGLDTVVGERGALMSGGERQRFALARALLRNPELLILDEATGAVDSDGERRIMERLRTLDPRPMILIVAHRTDNLAVCDRVLTMADGRVTEDIGP